MTIDVVSKYCPKCKRETVYRVSEGLGRTTETCMGCELKMIRSTPENGKEKISAARQTTESA